MSLGCDAPTKTLLISDVQNLIIESEGRPGRQPVVDAAMDEIVAGRCCVSSVGLAWRRFACKRRGCSIWQGARGLTARSLGIT